MSFPDKDTGTLKVETVSFLLTFFTSPQINKTPDLNPIENISAMLQSHKQLKLTLPLLLRRESPAKKTVAWSGTPLVSFTQILVELSDLICLILTL